MGYVYSAECSQCGFSSKFRFGSGMSNVKTMLSAPAIELETGKFVVLNFLEFKDNESYVFYSDPSMQSNEDREAKKQTINWHSFVLNRKNNYCPRCKNFSLNFDHILLFFD